MKAYVLYSINDLRYKEVSTPLCPEHWALVQVKVAGICSSDIPRIFTKGTYHFPTIPGHEFAGVVSAVGSKEDGHWLGQRVGVFPLIPCKQCPQCVEHHYEMCSNYDYLGSRRDGGFAEYVVVPVWNLVALPDNVSYMAGAMLEPLTVALHAVKACSIIAGCNVAVIGTGMIGFCAAIWARRLGADSVIVIGRSARKLSIAEKCGINYLSSENNSQYDVVIEAVGVPDTISQAIETAKPGGTVILIGNPARDVTLLQDIYWRILRKQLTLKGVWNSSYDGRKDSEWTVALAALSEGKIDVSPFVTHCFSQNCLIHGLELMRKHNESFCKVMTLWNQQ